MDEVADIPLPLQIKLLRVLEQGEVLPVGAEKAVTTRFRVVSATHQDLTQLVRDEKFRHDLYYRLCAFEINVPALRERSDDIPLLATHFASKLTTSLSLAEESLTELKRRPWHGNVRELRNAIEHAQVLARAGVVLPEHLPSPQLDFDGSRIAHLSLSAASARRAQELLNDPHALGAVYHELLQEVELPLLTRAMQQFDNECAPAARALGLHRTTLKKKLLQHNLTTDLPDE